MNSLLSNVSAQVITNFPFRYIKRTFLFFPIIDSYKEVKEGEQKSVNLQISKVKRRETGFNFADEERTYREGKARERESKSISRERKGLKETGRNQFHSVRFNSNPFSSLSSFFLPKIKFPFCIYGKSDFLQRHFQRLCVIGSLNILFRSRLQEGEHSPHNVYGLLEY